MSRVVAWVGFAGLLVSMGLAPSVAHAAPADDDDKSDSSGDDEKSDDEKSGDEKSDDEKSDDEKSGDEKSAADKEDVAEAAGGDSPVEEEGKTYHFVGARYRGVFAPKFIQNMFAEGGRTVYVNGFGPEFGVRRNGFEYNLSPWIALYNMDETAFKGKDDPEAAWELIKSRIQVLYLTSDFLWTHDFTPEVGLNYGIGAGLGIVFGKLYRAQSYPTAPGQDPNDYQKCIDKGVPNPVYCDDKNDNYGNHTEANWFSGGSKPVFYPWFTVQTGLRFKPTRHFAGRLDFGFGTSGFFLGVGGDYGL